MHKRCKVEQKKCEKVIHKRVPHHHHNTTSTLLSHTYIHTYTACNKEKSSCMDACEEDVNECNPIHHLDSTTSTIKRCKEEMDNVKKRCKET